MSEPQTNNSLKANDEVEKALLILRTKLDDEAWTGQQDIEFVHALAQALAVIGFLAEETQKLLQSSFAFMRDVAASPLVGPVDSSVSTAPTQTPASAGSRATRRTRERVSKKPVQSSAYTPSRGAEHA